MGGGNSSNTGSINVMLKPWNERKKKGESVEGVIEKVNAIAAKVQEAVIFSINPPAIPGLGMTSGMEMEILDINNLGTDALMQTIEEMKAKAADDPRLAQLTTQFQGSVPQYHIQINRERAKMLNLTLDDIYSTISGFMGGSYVNDFVKFGRTYQVTIAADESARSQPENILALTVRNSDGDMVPFSSFAEVVPSMGQPTINRYNMYNTASITGTPAKGVSSEDAIIAMEKILKEAVGENFSYAWTGEAYEETQAGTTVSTVLLFAVIITILVLAAQYESWTDPIAVVISMPTAILGTVLGCVLMGQSISIYTQIGIILLLGLAAKNAILIVEYAIDFRKQGKTIREAAQSAGDIRFRPIMMTALAFIFGVMPMLFATGAGAASRIALGTAVVFGMAVNAIVGTLFVPGFWELLETFREKYLSKIFASSDSVDGASSGNAPDTSATKNESDSI